MNETLKGAVERVTEDLILFDGITAAHFVKEESVEFGNDLRTILTSLATQAATLETMASALEAADQFITNGVALGFIRMPDPETPDSALLTPSLIRTTLTQYRRGDL